MEEKQKELLTDALEDSRKFYEQWIEQFGGWYHVQGKTIPEWRDHFRINLPSDIGTETCKSVDIKLISLFQEAHGYKGKAEAALSMAKAGYASKFRAGYASLVRSFTTPGKKLPAKDTLATLTEEKLGKEKDALAMGETEVTFWKEMLANLNTVRKIIENATLNISVEAKALNYQNMLDNIERKENHK